MPRRVVLAFGEALSEGDAAAAADCFAPQGCLLTPDGTEVVGRERIREVLAQLTAGRAEIGFEPPRILSVGSVALCSQRWSIRLAGGTTGSFEQTSLATVVLRRSEDDWELLISAPWSQDGPGRP